MARARWHGRHSRRPDDHRQRPRSDRGEAVLKPATLAIAKARSNNAKLGEAATTYVAQSSCPSDCVFFDGGGCYAESGAVGKFVTAPLNAAAAECEHDAIDVALAEAEAIDSLEVIPGRPLRLHTVGDCATNLAALIVAAAAKRYTDAGGGPVWTYSHAWRSVDRAAWGTVSVLASCETGEDVTLARSRGYATALVVERFESDKRYEAEIGPRIIHESIHELGGGHGAQGDPATPEVWGHETPAAEHFGVGAVSSRPRQSTPILPCPAQTRDVPCSDCRLCFDDAGLKARGYSIGFELHGIPYAVRQARRALREPENPRRKMLAEDELRELLAQDPNLSAASAAEAVDLDRAYAGQLLAFLRGQAEHPSVLRRRRYDRKRAA